MKIAVEILGDLSAAIAALLWFGSASIRFKERNKLSAVSALALGTTRGHFC
jgi:hypothetical protein